jgi:hypothetical protein
MAHILYRQDLTPIGELSVSSVHWLLVPTWLDGHRKEIIDWGTTRVFDLTKGDVERLVAGRYTPEMRELPSWEKQYLAQKDLLDGLGNDATYIVDWIECY